MTTPSSERSRPSVTDRGVRYAAIGAALVLIIGGTVSSLLRGGGSEVASSTTPTTLPATSTTAAASTTSTTAVAATTSTEGTTTSTTTTTTTIPATGTAVAPTRWTVIGNGSVNGRSAPGLGASIIGTFQPGDSLIGTGNTANADGYLWVEIAAGEERPVTWVASTLLMPVLPPGTECWATEDYGTVVVVTFSADAETFTGVLVTRAGGSDDLSYRAVAGRRITGLGSVFDVVVRDPAGGGDATEEWEAMADGVSSSTGAFYPIGDCADHTAEIAGIAGAVDEYPPLP